MDANTKTGKLKPPAVNINHRRLEFFDRSGSEKTHVYMVLFPLPAWLSKRALYMADLILKDECYQIIGLCMKVHNKLGKGFKEIVCKDALEIELKNAGIPYEREKEFYVKYDNEPLRRFRVDFWIYNAIILDAKAVSRIPTTFFKDMLNYLKTSGIQLGLLVNFGSDRLYYKRIVCTY